jgi:hypothetical protein
VLFRSIVWTYWYILAFVHWTWTHPSGLFHADPNTMMTWLDQRERVYRWQIMDSLLTTHLGPSAWDEPGP